jgi:hypothetical protein
VGGGGVVGDNKKRKGVTPFVERSDRRNGTGIGEDNVGGGCKVILPGTGRENDERGGTGGGSKDNDSGGKMIGEGVIREGGGEGHSDEEEGKDEEDDMIGGGR